jgi:phenylalanyl-tRNA synthetase beta chain
VQLPAPQPVTLRVARAAKVIGMPVTQAQVRWTVLQRLGLPVSPKATARDHGDAAELPL